MTEPRSTRMFYAVALGVLALDQVTKYFARAELEYGRAVTVIPGFLDLRLGYNTGGAFGVLPGWTPMFVLVALVAMMVIFRLRGAGARSRSLSVGLGLLLGGAVGNLIDRIGWPERGVTDFLDFYLVIGGERREWPTFNIADAAIVMGAILVFFYVYVVERRRANEEPPAPG